MIAFGVLRTTISFVGILNRSFISRVFYLIINHNIFSQYVTINKFCQSKHMITIVTSLSNRSLFNEPNEQGNPLVEPCRR